MRRDPGESRVAAVVEYIADRLAVMRAVAGSIVAKGACAYVLNRPQDTSTRTCSGQCRACQGAEGSSAGL